MKKVLFVAGMAILSLASCKKDYTCSCESTTVDFTYPNPPVYNGTKDDAKALCDAYEITLQSTAETTNIKCDLK